METEIKNLPRSQVEIHFKLSSRELEPYLTRAASRLARDLNLKGFRPGQVPQSLIEERFGWEKLYHEAAALAIQDEYPKFILGRNLPAIGQPKLEIGSLTKEGPITFRVTVAILPEVKLPDYSALAQKLEKQRPKDFLVSEKELDSAINWLLRSRAQYSKVKRPAQKGDYVEVDFEAKIEGKEVQGASSKNHPLILGEGRFLPGFEQNLEGLKEGEEKDFSLKSPQNYWKKELAGKTIDFDVRVKSVQEIKIPEFNDEFAQKAGRFSSVQELKKSIQEGLNQEKIDKEKEEFRLKLLEAITEKSQVELPEVLVQAELSNLVQELIINAQSVGLSLEDYLKQIKKTPEELVEVFRPQAQKRAKIGLVVETLAKKEGIAVTEKEVVERINVYLRRFASVKQAEREVDLPRLRAYTEGVIRSKKVLDKLEEIAKD